MTDFKRHRLAHLKKLEKCGRTSVLTVTGRARLVVQDAAPYQPLLDDLDRAQAIAGIQRGSRDEAEGHLVSVDAAFSSIRRKKQARSAS